MKKPIAARTRLIKSAVLLAIRSLYYENVSEKNCFQILTLPLSQSYAFRVPLKQKSFFSFSVDIFF